MLQYNLLFKHVYIYIGKFFVQKIVNIRSRLVCHGVVNYHKPDKESTESSFVHLTELEMLTEQDVKSLMQHSPLDPMPSTLVSRCDVPLSTLFLYLQDKSICPLSLVNFLSPGRRSESYRYLKNLASTFSSRIFVPLITYHFFRT